MIWLVSFFLIDPILDAYVDQYEEVGCFHMTLNIIIKIFIDLFTFFGLLSIFYWAFGTNESGERINYWDFTKVFISLPGYVPLIISLSAGLFFFPY